MMWRENMTAEDHARNAEDFRREQYNELSLAKSRVEQWQREVDRLNGLLHGDSSTAP